jgi:hypothetical protein
MRTYLLSSSASSEVSSLSPQGIVTQADDKKDNDRSAGTTAIRVGDELKSIPALRFL